MRGTQSSGAMRCVLLAALAGSLGAHAAVSDAPKPISTKPVSAVANTQASAHRQGAFKASGVNWTCKKLHCSASVTPSTVAAPMTACQALAHEVGAIKSFKVANHALNPQELQQCNSVAAVVEAAKPSVKKPQVATKPTTTPDPAPSASPHSKRLITADDLTLRAQPLPDAPHRAATSPRTPSTNTSGSPSAVAKPTTTTNPVKKPAGAKGTTQAAAQGDGVATPQPPPVGTAAPSVPGSRSYPVSIRTEAMAVTGTGRLIDRLAYTRKDIRTEAMTVTGTGRVTVNLPFTPKSVRTDGMAVTGTGSVR